MPAIWAKGAQSAGADHTTARASAVNGPSHDQSDRNLPGQRDQRVSRVTLGQRTLSGESKRLTGAIGRDDPGTLAIAPLI